MAKKPKTADQKSQSERFIEAAKKAGVDESGRAFAKAFAKITSPGALKSKKP